MKPSTLMLQKGLLLAWLCLLAGCGRQVARLPFTTEGTAATTVTLQAGELRFWTDIELKYEGAAEVAYSIELEQAGTTVARAECDPLTPDFKLGWVETQFGTARSLSGSGRMRCEASVPKPGPTTVRAVLTFKTKPPVLDFKKADLLLKQ